VLETTDTRDRILIAAIEAASIHGIARLSVGDVAQRAGLSRQTLYKHFPSKDALVAAAVLSEALALVDQVLAAGTAHDDPKSALEAAVLATLRLTRAHPLLDRIIRTEPEALLPFLTSDGGPVMLFVRQAVEGVLVEQVPEMGEVAIRRLADMIARLLVSYAINAPDDPPEVVAAFVSSFLVDGALQVVAEGGPTAEATPTEKP
jgi:AcrR family transcriptional regulator